MSASMPSMISFNLQIPSGLEPGVTPCTCKCANSSTLASIGPVTVPSEPTKLSSVKPEVSLYQSRQCYQTWFYLSRHSHPSHGCYTSELSFPTPTICIDLLVASFRSIGEALSYSLEPFDSEIFCASATGAWSRAQAVIHPDLLLIIFSYPILRLVVEWVLVDMVYIVICSILHHPCQYIKFECHAVG